LRNPEKISLNAQKFAQFGHSMRKRPALPATGGWESEATPLAAGGMG